MEKITIDDLKNHLPEFQDNLECEGEVRLLKEFIVPDALCKKMPIEREAKLLFIYMGTDKEYHDVHHYLIWLENEGGMLVDLPFSPDDKRNRDKELVLTNEGSVGYGITISVPVKMVVTWTNNRPQIEKTRTGEIIEWADVPSELPLENVLEDYITFNIAYLLFGNPNFILSLPEDMSACLSYMTPDGNNDNCLCYDFDIGMKQEGAQLRQLIIEAGDADPKEYEKIIGKFWEESRRR
jgi:hypothetical protein